MDRIALVTGANRGIGFEACRQLAQRGMHVVLTSRDPALGEKSAAILRAEGLQITTYPLDVTRLVEVEAARDFIIEHFGRLDVLVNNAGVYLDRGIRMLEIPVEMVEETMAVNFYGPLHTTQAFIPNMIEHNYGRVVNVSSSAGSLSAMTAGGSGMGAYAISKAALNALTRLTAKEVRAYNIKINTMGPGWVRTRLGGRGAARSPAQGVDTIIWLATLPKSGPTGGFFMDRKPHPW
jgi:NAD(P)-dependent dehydrogenase (short-subunit alcohol dehydrogenase family)